MPEDTMIPQAYQVACAAHGAVPPQEEVLLWEQAALACRAAGLPIKEADSLNNAAARLLDIGNVDAAERDLVRALALYEKTREHRRVQLCQLNVAEVRHARGNLNGALALLEEAYTALQSSGDED